MQHARSARTVTACSSRNLDLEERWQLPSPDPLARRTATLRATGGMSATAGVVRAADLGEWLPEPGAQSDATLKSPQGRRPRALPRRQCTSKPGSRPHSVGDRLRLIRGDVRQLGEGKGGTVIGRVAGLRLGSPPVARLSDLIAAYSSPDVVRLPGLVVFGSQSSEGRLARFPGVIYPHSTHGSGDPRWSPTLCTSGTPPSGCRTPCWERGCTGNGWGVTRTHANPDVAAPEHRLIGELTSRVRLRRATRLARPRAANPANLAFLDLATGASVTRRR